MGLTIASKRSSIDMSYGGFMKLRRKTAELIGPMISSIYEEMNDIMWWPYDERAKAIEKHNEKLGDLYKMSTPPYKAVIDFLYKSDTEGELSYRKCKYLLSFLEDKDIDLVVGYIGRPDHATFKDFVRLLTECVEDKSKLEWY